MKTTLDLIVKGNLISAGNFLVSIGAFDRSDVAIISKWSGDFVSLKSCKKSKKLKSVKRKFKIWLNNPDTFHFQFMTPDMTVDLINLLKK